MKKKFTYFVAAVCAALTFSACSSDKLEAYSGQTLENPESPSNAISFGTYMGKTGTTRAGYENTTGMTTALLKDGGTSGGFGVFAYYTGKNTYGQQQKSTYTSESGSASNISPNFMYNQQVTYSTDHWTYDPIKYWPNDFANPGAVDNQSDAAQGSDTYGGNVSFFAYAPYVEVTQATAANIDGANPATGAINGSITADGITHLSGNAYAGDPIVTYTIPSDINEGGNWVDLLWGTANGTSQKATDTGTANTNTGVGGSAIQGSPGTTHATAILDDNFVNANLNKQKVDGTVGFLFKHALAKIGGGNSNAKVGFLVQLDLDNKNDGTPSTAVTGGTRQTFNTSGSGEANAWRTIVTIKSIEITNDLNGATEGLGDGAVGLGGTATLNLATGQWSAPTSTDAFTQTIGGPQTTPTYNAVLNTKIAEYKTAGSPDVTWFTDLTSTNKYDYFTYTNAGTNADPNAGTHPGVTETAQSVYNDVNQSPIIVYPGTTPKFKVTVDYIVRTYDANLSGECTEVEQIISKVIQFANPVELNKYYTLLMHLGLTGIKFTASVSDWDDDTDGNGNIELEQAEDVHLPINVNVSTAATVEAGSTATVYTDDTNTSYTITVNGVINTHAYTATVTGEGSPSIDSSSGSFDATSKAFTVTLPANTTTSSRDFVVTITDTAADPNIVTTVTIKQLGTE